MGCFVFWAYSSVVEFSSPKRATEVQILMGPQIIYYAKRQSTIWDGWFWNHLQ